MMNARLSCLTSPRVIGRVPTPLSFPARPGQGWPGVFASAPAGPCPLRQWAAAGWLAGLLLGTILHFTWPGAHRATRGAAAVPPPALETRQAAW